LEQANGECDHTGDKPEDKRCSNKDEKRRVPTKEEPDAKERLLDCAAGKILEKRDGIDTNSKEGYRQEKPPVKIM
jgi:hypothetical protein